MGCVAVVLKTAWTFQKKKNTYTHNNTMYTIYTYANMCIYTHTDTRACVYAPGDAAVITVQL